MSGAGVGGGWEDAEPPCLNALRGVAASLNFSFRRGATESLGLLSGVQSGNLGKAPETQRVSVLLYFIIIRCTFVHSLNVSEIKACLKVDVLSWRICKYFFMPHRNKDTSSS